MKALEGTFNQEKALVGAFSVITKLCVDLRFKLCYRQPQQESSYLPQSDYHKLQQKLSTNDQLRSYIKTLRQQLNEYKNIVPHNHERGTIVDLNQYNSGR